MTHPATQKPTVLMLCTRDISANARSGRERTMGFIQSALAAAGETRVFRLHSLLEARSLRRIARAFLASIAGLMRGRPVPLQCLLFFDPRYVPKLCAAIDVLKPTALYFDGVRSGFYAPILRKLYPELRFVCDFDDLMSHRMEVLAATGQPMSLGYLKKLAPLWLQRVLETAASRAFVLYEWHALRKVEAHIARCCEKIVLVSPVEGERLRHQVPGAPVTVIPPVLPPIQATLSQTPIGRFVFIGSDTLVQNRLTIEYLVNLWDEIRPSTPLHIFGKQNNSYRAVPGVILEGFVDNVADAYAPGSIMLAPSFFRGGVKTKVLEAMTFGVVPVGTDITFEGVQAECSTLVLTENEMRDLIRNPTAWGSRLLHGGAKAISQVVELHAPERIAAAWANAVWPSQSNDRQQLKTSVRRQSSNA